MKPTQAFQERLYGEMLARIKEDDETVPYRRGGHFYFARTEKGKQYPIYCRKAGTLAAPEEVTLDLNALAAGLPFIALGMYSVSDDGHLLAYTIDTTGFREYTLYVKDLRTGVLLPDRIERVSSIAWAADSATLFHVTEDDAKRAYRLWRHRLGERDDALLWEEEDELFRLGVWRSRSRAFVLCASRSFTTTEHRYLPADRVEGAWRTILAREKDHEYEVDHGSGPLLHPHQRGRAAQLPPRHRARRRSGGGALDGGASPSRGRDAGGRGRLRVPLRGAGA